MLKLLRGNKNKIKVEVFPGSTEFTADFTSNSKYYVR